MLVCFLSDAWLSCTWNSDDDCDVVLVIISRSPSSCCTSWPCRSWAGPWSCPRPASHTPSSWQSNPDTRHKVINVRNYILLVTSWHITWTWRWVCPSLWSWLCSSVSSWMWLCLCLSKILGLVIWTMIMILPTCGHGRVCESGQLHGCGLLCVQTHDCKANTFWHNENLNQNPLFCDFYTSDLQIYSSLWQLTCVGEHVCVCICVCGSDHESAECSPREMSALDLDPSQKSKIEGPHFSSLLQSCCKDSLQTHKWPKRLADL